MAKLIKFKVTITEERFFVLNDGEKMPDPSKGLAFLDTLADLDVEAYDEGFEARSAKVVVYDEETITETRNQYFGGE